MHALQQDPPNYDMTEKNLDITYSVTRDEINGLLSLLREMIHKQSHTGDSEAKAFYNAVAEAYLKAPKIQNRPDLQNLRMCVKFCFPSEQETEIENALVWHIKNKDVEHAEFGKIHLKATYDALTNSKEFKEYLDFALNSGVPELIEQAILNQKLPWLR